MADENKEELKRIKKEISSLISNVNKCEQHLKTLTKDMSLIDRSLREIIKINERNTVFTEKLFNFFEKSKNETLLEELVDSIKK